MFSVLLVLLGFITLIVSVTLNINIDKKTIESNLEKTFPFSSLLIIFFIVAYSYYLFKVFYDYLYKQNNDVLIPVIFFLNAIFVLTSTVAKKNFSQKIFDKTKNLDEVNSTLKDNYYRLKKQKQTLEKSEKRLTEKTAKLEELMEDFYTLRINMEKESGDKVKEENQQISKILKTIKGKKSDRN